MAPAACSASHSAEVLRCQGPELANLLASQLANPRPYTLSPSPKH